jgi:hypothetical protein
MGGWTATVGYTYYYGFARRRTWNPYRNSERARGAREIMNEKEISKLSDQELWDLYFKATEESDVNLSSEYYQELFHRLMN